MRYFYALFLFLIPSLLFADVDTFEGQTGTDTWESVSTTDTREGQTVASGGVTDSCPDATYDFAWTGDCTSSTTTGCIDDGTGTVAVKTNITVDFHTDYGQTGYGVKLDAATDSLCWTVNETATTGTMWFTMYTHTPLTAQGDILSLNDGSTKISMDVYIGSDHGRGVYSGQSTPDATYTDDPANVRCGYTWDLSGTDKHKFVWDSTNWADGDEDTEALTILAGNISEICIGDNGLAGGTGAAKETYVDDVYFINGTYEGSDPKP